MVFEKDVSLKDYTTFKIGGRADYFFSPSDLEELKGCFEFIHGEKLPFFVLGGGSNILVSDDGFRGVVVYTGRLNEISVSSSKEGGISLNVGAGSSVKDLVIFSAGNGFSGLEEFYGLPGTVGGATFMNARCYGKEFSDVVSEVVAFDTFKKDVKVLKRDEIFLGYKRTIFQRNVNLFIFEVRFSLKIGKKKKIFEKMNHFIKDRELKGQFLYPNAGCIFKNNREFGEPTGVILERVGLKGVKRGGVKFFEKHANFIVNFDNGRAEDVLYLINMAKDVVYKKFKFSLEEEIGFLGFK